MEELNKKPDNNINEPKGRVPKLSFRDQKNLDITADIKPVQSFSKDALSKYLDNLRAERGFESSTDDPPKRKDYIEEIPDVESRSIVDRLSPEIVQKFSQSIKENSPKYKNNPLYSGEAYDYGQDVSNSRYLPANFSYLSPASVAATRGANQSRFRKASYGVGRFANTAILEMGKTAGMIGGGILSGGEAGIRLLTNNWEGYDFFSDVFDNAFVNKLDEIENTISEELFPVHFRREVEEGGLWKQLSSMESWATTGAEMAGYAVMMFAPSSMFNYGRFGQKVVGQFNKVRKVKKSLLDSAELGNKTVHSIDGLNKTFSFGQKAADLGLPTNAQMINRYGETLGSLIADGGNEAFSAGQQYEMGLQERLQRGEITKDEFDNLLAENKSKVIRNTFLTNIPIQIGPKFVMSKLLWGGASRNRSGMHFLSRGGRTYVDDAGNLVTKAPTVFDYGLDASRATITSLGRSAWELPSQIAAREFFVENPDAGIGNFISEFVPSYLDAINSTDGQQALFFGNFTGTIAGIRSSIINTKAEYAAATRLSEFANQNIDKFWRKMHSDVYIRNKYGDAEQATDADGNLKFNRDGSPVFKVDEAKVKENVEILNELGYAGEAFEKAALENDVLLMDYIRNKSYLSIVYPFVINESLGLDILRESLEVSDNLAGYAASSGQKRSDVIDSIIKMAENLRHHHKVFDSYAESVLNIQHENATFNNDISPYLESLKTRYIELRHDQHFYEQYSEKLRSDLDTILEGSGISVSEFESFEKEVNRLAENVRKQSESLEKEIADDFTKGIEFAMLVDKINQGDFTDLSTIAMEVFKDDQFYSGKLDLTPEQLERFRELFFHFHSDLIPSNARDAYTAPKEFSKNPKSGEVEYNVNRKINHRSKQVEYTFEKLDQDGKATRDRYKEYSSAKEVLRDLQRMSKFDEEAKITKEGAKAIRDIIGRSKDIKLVKMEYNPSDNSSRLTFLVDGKTRTVRNAETGSRLSTMFENSGDRYKYKRHDLYRELEDIRELIKEARDAEIVDENKVNILKHREEKILEDINHYLQYKDITPRSIDEIFESIEARRQDLQNDVDSQINESIKSLDETIYADPAEFAKKNMKDARLRRYRGSAQEVNAELQRVKDEQLKIWDNEKNQKDFDKLMEEKQVAMQEARVKQEEAFEKQLEKIRKAMTLEDLEEAVAGSKNKKVIQEARKREKVIKEGRAQESAEKAQQQEKESQSNSEKNSKQSEKVPVEYSVERESNTENDVYDNDPNGILNTENDSYTGESVPSGGTRIMGLNNDGSKPDYISQEFVNWLLDPRDKRNDPVTFEITENPLENIPSTHSLYAEFKKAVDIFKNKIEGKDKNEINLTDGELSTVIDYLPLNAVVGQGISSPIATRPFDKNQKTQSDFINNDRVLRSNLLYHYIDKGTFEGYSTVVEGQYAGMIKMSPNPEPGKAAVNNIFDLYEFTNKESGEKLARSEKIAYIRENISFVDSQGNLVKLNGEKIPHSKLSNKVNIPKGEIFLELTATNGARVPVKLNTERISKEHADLIADMYEMMLNNNLREASTLDSLDDSAQDLLLNNIIDVILNKPGSTISESSKELSELFGKNLSDLTFKDIIGLLTMNSPNSFKGRFGFHIPKGQAKADAVFFGNHENRGKHIKFDRLEMFDKAEFSEWLQNNKRYAVNMRVNESEGLNQANISTNTAYLEWLIDNKLLNTNGVVNEPLFSAGYTGVYIKVDNAKKTRKPNPYRNYKKVNVPLSPENKASVGEVVAKVKSFDQKLDSLEKNYYVTLEDGTTVKLERASHVLNGEMDLENKPKNVQETIKASLEVGTSVHSVMEDFFNGSLKDYTHYGIFNSINDLHAMVDVFAGLKDDLSARGERVVFTEMPIHSLTMALGGTIDLVTIDRDGKWRIYDLKTFGNQLNLNTNFDGYVKEVAYGRQLSAYKLAMLETLGINIESAEIIPMKISYDRFDKKVTSPFIDKEVDSTVRTVDTKKSGNLETITTHDGKVIGINRSPRIPLSSLPRPTTAEIKSANEKLAITKPVISATSTVSTTTPTQTTKKGGIDGAIVDKSNQGIYTPKQFNKLSIKPGEKYNLHYVGTKVYSQKPGQEPNFNNKFPFESVLKVTFEDVFKHNKIQNIKGIPHKADDGSYVVYITEQSSPLGVTIVNNPNPIQKYTVNKPVSPDGVVLRIFKDDATAIDYFEKMHKKQLKELASTESESSSESLEGTGVSPLSVSQFTGGKTGQTAKTPIKSAGTTTQVPGMTPFNPMQFVSKKSEKIDVDTTLENAKKDTSITPPKPKKKTNIFNQTSPLARGTTQSVRQRPAMPTKKPVKKDKPAKDVVNPFKEVKTELTSAQTSIQNSGISKSIQALDNVSAVKASVQIMQSLIQSGKFRINSPLHKEIKNISNVHERLQAYVNEAKKHNLDVDKYC